MADPVFDPTLPTQELSQDEVRALMPTVARPAIVPQIDPSQPITPVSPDEFRRLPKVILDPAEAGASIGPDERSTFQKAQEFVADKLGPAAALPPFSALLGKAAPPMAKAFPRPTAADIAQGNWKAFLPGVDPETGESYFSQHTKSDPAPTAAKVAAGVTAGAASIGESVAPWLLVPGLGGGGGLPGRAISAAFAIDLVRNIPEAGKRFIDAIQRGDVQDAVETGIEGTLGAYFTYKSAQHAVARKGIPRIDAQGNPVIDPKTGEQIVDKIGLAEESPAIRAMLTRKTVEQFSPEEIKATLIKVSRGEGTPAENEFAKFINEAIESPGQAAKRGVEVTTHTPRIESEFLRNYLGLKPRTQSIELMGKEGQNYATPPIFDSSRVPTEPSGVDEVGKTQQGPGARNLLPSPAGEPIEVAPTRTVNPPVASVVPSPRAPESLTAADIAALDPSHYTIWRSAMGKDLPSFQKQLAATIPIDELTAHARQAAAQSTLANGFAAANRSDENTQTAIHAMGKVHFFNEVLEMAGEKKIAPPKPEAPVETPKSSTQLTVPKEQSLPFAKFGASIPPSEVYSKPDAHGKEDYGVDTDPHITVLYGLTEHEPAAVAKIVAQRKPITVTLGKLSVFKGKDYDVLKVDVHGDDLHALNKEIAKLPNEQTHPDYTPHLTIAYMKKGEADKYVGDARFDGMKMTFPSVTFSPPSEIRAKTGRHELPFAPEAPVPAKKPKGRSIQPAKKAEKWTSIGRNSKGDDVFEDERGVRSVVRNGIRVTEAVELIPTRAGMTIGVKSAEDRKGTEFEVVQERIEQTPFVPDAPATLTPLPPGEITLYRWEQLVKPEGMEENPDRGLWFGSDPKELETFRTMGGTKKRLIQVTIPSTEAAKYRRSETGFVVSPEIAERARTETERAAGDIADLSEADLDKLLDEVEAETTPEKPASKPAPAVKRTPSKTKAVRPAQVESPRVKSLREELKKLRGGLSVAEDMAMNDKGASLDRLNAKIDEKQAELDAALAAGQLQSGRGGKLPTQSKEKTPADIIADAAKSGVKGTDAAVKGLYKLFGGNVGSGPTFDEKTYAEAKPHFEESYKQFKESGRSLRDFFRWVYDNFGKNVRAYLKRFVQDLQAADKGVTVEADADLAKRGGRAPASDVATTGGGGGGSNPDNSGRVGGVKPPTNESVGGGQKPGVPSEGSTGTGGGSPTPGGSGRSETPVGARDQRALRRTPQPSVSKNYVITDADRLGQGTITEKIRDNFAAIRLVKLLEAENRIPTMEEKGVLVRYVGWGGIKGVFNPDNEGMRKQAAELRSLLTDEEYERARSSIQDAHFTSQTVITHGLYNALLRMGFTGGKMVEGGVGIGNMIGLMPDDIRAVSTYVGVERDPLTARIAQYLYPEAKIQLKGFQEADLTRDHFDGSVGNPPFGKKAIFDKKFKASSKFTIHNYFIAKSLELTRPGGLVAQVVSRYFLDNAEPAAREHIASLGEFLGAIRLPNTAFKENANTEVVTDLVFFLRLPEGVKADDDWTKVVDYTDPKTGLTWKVNKWIAVHPEMVMGDMTRAKHGLYGKDEMSVEARPGQDLAADLDKAVENLPKDVYEQAPASVERRTTTPIAEVPEGIKVGGYFVQGRTIARRLPDVNGERTAVVADMKEGTAERVRAIIPIRDALNALIKLEGAPDSSDAEIEKARGTLNKTYDAFVRRFGFLNSLANRRAFYDDSDNMRVLGLERDYTSGISAATAKKKGVDEIKPDARKADIFTKRVNAPYQEVTKVGTPKEALTVSLNQRGGVDIQHMMDLTGMERAPLIDALAGLVFKTPDGDYQSKEQYLSGNVRAKLNAARAALESGDREMEGNIKALTEVIPKDIDPFDIIAPIGAPWVSPEDVSAFAEELTGSPPRVVQFLRSNGGWAFEHHDASTASTQKWGTSRVPFGDMMKLMLNGKTIVVYDTTEDAEGKEIRIVNQPETELASAKSAEVREKWQEWIWRDQARRERLHRVYNDNYNNYVDFKADGGHLVLPGASSVITLNPHQKNVVWRTITTGGDGLLYDQVVGSGKTFAGVASMMEMKRLGRVRKWLVTVPNHLTGQWADSFNVLYPNANVLAARPSDFTKDNRQKLFSKILTGDYDAVILGHSSLKKVGTSPEVEKGILDEMMGEIVDTIEALRLAEGGSGRRRSSRQVAQLERTRDNIQAKLDRLANIEGRDAVAQFEELGFDGLMVDEAHEFKNLYYTTQMQNVAGLGNPTGSAKAFDLYLKTRFLRARYNGHAPCVFLTGTPISNSLVEMFTMQRYLQPKVLDEMGLKTLDAWARVFADVKSVYEVDPTGTGYRMATRFASFQNVGELTAIYRNMADVITMNDLQAQAEASNKRFPVPKVAGGKPNNLVSERTPEQAEYFGIETQVLDSEGKPQFDSEGTPVTAYPQGTILWRVDNMPDDPREDNMLKLTNDARKAGLDMRLNNPRAADRPTSKVNVSVGEIVRLYKEWDARKGTQLVFCDLSVPSSARGRATKEAKTGGLGYFINVNGILTAVDDAKPVKLESAPNFDFFVRKSEAGNWIVSERTSGTSTGAAGKTQAEAIQKAETMLASLKPGVLEEAVASKQPSTEALAELAARVQKAPEETDEVDDTNAEQGVSVDELLADQSSFSVYDDMREKLLKAGIPANQIAFIHDYDTPEKKQKLFKQVNDGDVRILFGSTAKMGAGTNVQRRVVALHHLDAPWRPSDLEQREGRVIRQGNLFYEEAMKGYASPQDYDKDPNAFAVTINRYATALTYDTRMWQLIEHKAAGIEGFRKADRTTRTIEDVSGEAANASDMKAAASGDPLIQQEMQLRNERTKLELLKRAWDRNRAELQTREGYLADYEKRYQSRVKEFNERKSFLAAHTPVDDKGKERFEFTMPDGKKTDEKGVPLQYVADMLKEGRRGYFGRYRGVDFSFEPWVRKVYDQEIKGVTFYKGKDQFGFTNQVTEFSGDEKLTGVGLFQRFDNALEVSDQSFTGAERGRDNDKKSLDEVRQETAKTFTKDALLNDTRVKHEVVRSQLMNKKKRQAVVQQSIGDVVKTPITAAEAEATVRAMFQGAVPPNIRFINDPLMPRGRAVLVAGQPADITLNLAKLATPEDVADTLNEELIHAVWDDPAIAGARQTIESLITDVDRQRQAEEGYNPDETEEEAANERARRIFNDAEKANFFVRAWRAIMDVLRRLFGFQSHQTAADAARTIMREARRNAPTTRTVQRGAEPIIPPEDTGDAGINLADIELGAEMEKALAEEGATTEVLGRVDTILGRDTLNRAAGAPYAATVFAAAGVPVVDRGGLWALAPDATEESGQRLLDALRTEIARQNQPDKTNTGNLGNLLNSVVVNMTRDDVTQFSSTLKRDLYAVAQGERSQRGIQLAALAGFSKSVEYVARNVDVILHKTYSDAFGGETVSTIMQRVLREFRAYFTDEEVANALKNAPGLEELVDRIIAMNRQDEGGRVFRRAQGLLKPKNEKKLAALNADARVEEAVRNILAQLKDQGIEPNPNPNKPLPAVDRLLLLIEPKNAARVNKAVAAAISQAERNAGIKAALAEADPDEREALAKEFKDGADPGPEHIEEGLSLPEYAHWRALRDNLLDYSPVTLKLAQDVVKGDFRGTRFAPVKPRAAAQARIDLNALAVSPDKEVNRVVTAYLDDLMASMDLTRATDETKARVLEMVKTEVATQLEQARARQRDILLSTPKSVTHTKTPDQVLAEKLHTGIFSDERLDLPGMVDRMAAKGPFKRVTPSAGSLVRRVLETPAYKQAEFSDVFADLMVDQYGVSKTEADNARRVFKSSFSASMKLAQDRALKLVEASLTPKERADAPVKSPTWRKITDAVHAGLFDSGDVLKRIAAEHGWVIPTDEQLAKFKTWADRIDRLKDLTARELKEAGSDPLQIERFRRDKLAYTLNDRIKLKKEIETLWARLTAPMKLFGPGKSRENMAQAVNDFVSANLLTRIAFVPRQFIDAVTSEVLNTFNRSMATALGRWSDNREAGRSAQLWQEMSIALKDAYRNRVASYRAALVAARDAMAGRGDVHNVERLLSRVALFERATQKADEYEAAGDNVRAGILRLFALLRIGHRMAQAFDQLHGIPAEHQEMRSQVIDHLRENGETSAEAFKNAEDVMGDMRAEYALAVERVKQIASLNGETLTPQKIRSKAWNMVKARAYQRMREMGMPADDFEAQNAFLRNVYGWNEREAGGVGGAVAGAMTGFRNVFARAGVPMPPAAFANAIGTMINRMLAFTPLGFFPAAFEGSPWHDFKRDPKARYQRKIEAAEGTVFYTLLGLLIVLGVVKYNNRAPSDPRERELWEKQGHRAGTLEIPLGDGSFIPISGNVGPLAMGLPYLAMAGAIRDLMDKRAVQQAHADADAARRGVAPRPIAGVSAADWMGVAAQAWWGALSGGRTASGVLGSFTDQGVPNVSKAVAGFVSPLVPLLPAAQEVGRMAGVRVDPKTATFLDFLLPLPTSAHRAVNMLGDPVGNTNDLQRIVQILTGGTYGIVTPHDAQMVPAYSALFASGFRPPSIAPGRGYAINGELRPMTADELARYTQARGTYLKEALAGLGDSPDITAVRAAYKMANARALNDVGAAPAQTSRATSSADVAQPQARGLSFRRGLLPARRSGARVGRRPAVGIGRSLRPAGPLRLGRSKVGRRGIRRR